MKYVDVVHESAKEIGAVNVLKIVREGDKKTITGYNSDIAGVEGSLRPYLDRQIKNALIFGTGGGSKAVSFTLKKLGITYKFVSIEGEEGTLNYDELDGELLKSVKLIVNTTPLGMYPNVETKPKMDYDLLNADHILFDIVYNPEKTAFLGEGMKRGCTTIPGITMFRLQAEQTWKYWVDQY